MFIVIVTNAPTSPVKETWLLCDGTQLSHVTDGHYASMLIRLGLPQTRPDSVDETVGLIKSCRTVTDCPPEWAGTTWATLWAESQS